ncbi:penicillin-binding protein activator LpoB [bacterium]|nr:penicillin-binding protein activator LpoB [bacterium]
MRQLTFNLTVWSFAILLTACGSRQFTQGEYDDVNEVRHLDDKFNESDAAILIEEMVGSMAEHPVFSKSKLPPIVQVEKVRNKTSEHVDTKMMTDSLRTALIKTGKVRFSNKEDRDTLNEEVDYQNESGRIRKDTRKNRSGGIGADYILTGDLISNVQEVGNRKLIFYRLNLNLTNLETNLIEWSDEKPIRKRYKKKSVGF